MGGVGQGDGAHGDQQRSDEADEKTKRSTDGPEGIRLHGINPYNNARVAVLIIDPAMS
jgi:hypothetical protein